MKKTVITFAIGIGLVACSQQQTPQISGVLEGVESDSVVVLVRPANFNGIDRTDTIALNNGKFAYELGEQEARSVVISPLSKEESASKASLRLVVMPQEKITISGTWENPVVSGSVFMEEQQAYTRSLAELQQEQVNALNQFKTISEEDEQGRNALRETIMEIQNKMDAQATEYITANPSSDFSAYLAASATKEKAKKIALLSEAARNGAMKNYIDLVMKKLNEAELRKAAAEKLTVGVEAPDFTLTDINGNPLALSSLRGKYVILDFWGSWCIWCIRGIPEMKNYYEKYQNKMEILGIDCRDTEAKWKAAVAKHNIPWKHVINNREDLDVSSLYGVSGYPTKIIVDPDGKIAKVEVGEDPNFYKYLDELFK